MKGKASIIIYMGKFPDWNIRDIAVLPERVETFPDCAAHETGTRVPTPQAPIQAAITLLGVRKTLSADVTAQ